MDWSGSDVSRSLGGVLTGKDVHFISLLSPLPDGLSRVTGKSLSKEATFGMRLNDEQEPNLRRHEGETLWEEQITNAKPLNWE